MNCERSNYAQSVLDAMGGSSKIQWWLRSPGGFTKNASLVEEGRLDKNFGLAVEGISGVRPAIWIKIEP